MLYGTSYTDGKFPLIPLLIKEATRNKENFALSAQMFPLIPLLIKEATHESMAKMGCLTGNTIFLFPLIPLLIKEATSLVNGQLETYSKFPLIPLLIKEATPKFFRLVTKRQSIR